MVTVQVLQRLDPLVNETVHALLQQGALIEPAVEQKGYYRTHKRASNCDQ